MNKLQALPFLVFFCLSTLTTVNSDYLCSASHGEARWDCDFNVPTRLSLLLTVPALRACWKPIEDTPGCTYSINLSSVDNNIIGLDGKCCGALLSLNHDCFKRLFSRPPSQFSREFGEKAVGYCASKRNKGNKANAPDLYSGEA